MCLKSGLLNETHRQLDDAAPHADQLYFDFKTSVEVRGTKWILVADVPAFSECHQDAGGYGTHLRPLLGFKVWTLLLGDNNIQLPTLRGWDDAVEQAEKGQVQYAVIGPHEDM